MGFDVCCYTDKGARENNEDYYGYKQKEDCGIFALADGLGGHACGEIASKLAVDYVLETFNADLNIDDDVLLGLLDGANNQILEYQKQNPQSAGLMSTIALGIYRDGIFKHLNVGDSRIYYFKNGCLYSQSKDHSVSQLAVDMGEITQEQVRFHSDRSRLLKALGDTENLNITKLAPPITIENSDAFLICSDGFWEYVFETEMELDLVKSETSREWCEFMCKRLLRRVTNNNDNFTVICGILA